MQRNHFVFFVQLFLHPTFLSSLHEVFSPPQLRQKKARATSFHWNCTLCHEGHYFLPQFNFAEVGGGTQVSDLNPSEEWLRNSFSIKDLHFSGGAGGIKFNNWKQRICLKWRSLSNGSCRLASFKTSFTLIGCKDMKNNGSEEISAIWAKGPS